MLVPEEFAQSEAEQQDADDYVEQGLGRVAEDAAASQRPEHEGARPVSSAVHPHRSAKALRRGWRWAASTPIVAMTATGDRAPTAAAEMSWTRNWFRRDSAPIGPWVAMLGSGGVTRRHPLGMIPARTVPITRVG